MSYKVLDKNLLPVGDLILENNIGATNFWGDQVTRQLAQDDSNQDPATTMSMTVNSTDAKANNKLWNHTLSLSFDNTEDVGSKVVAQDSYLLYQDEQTGRWYLMNVYQSDEYENYRTAQAQNSAIIELSKIYTTGKTFTQARLTDIVNYVFSFVPFSAQIADDSGIILDSYTIDKATSVQAIIQDLQVKYDVDVDAFVEMDNNGRINNRVISFEHVGHNNGAKIWYGSAVKGAESIQRTGISSTLYTKFYINGVAKDGDADSGSIKSVNAGKDYIVDDTANEMYNPIGASMDVPTYLEVRLENTLLSEPTALLSWGNKIVGLFNHPRFNYVVTSMHDADYGLGDTVVVNDDSKKPALVISSRVIQIITSQASPETNTITLGEFSNLFTVKNEQATTILTLKKDINIVQIAADNAVNQAQLAHNQAVEAQSKAIVAQATADGKTMSFTVASVEDLPVKANEGDIAWVTLEDGTHGYTFINGHWIEDINPNLKKSIQDGVTTAVAQAKAHTDEVKQGLSSDIATAKSQATSQASTAEANAKSEATSQFTQAKDALAEAKTDLTKSIASEASARNAAVAAANSQAQTYANQAKADAMSAASSADGVIRTAISSSADSLSATITQNKSSADSGISTAQTTAKAAVDGLALKVSKTDYDQKTGDLSTKINDVKETADSSAQTIADIKTADGKQDARMSEIENTASGLKSTVSDLQTAQGKQTGDISTLQQRADGFEASVTKINNTVNGLGQINQLMNTEFTPDLQGWTLDADKGSNAPYASFVGYGSRGIGFNTLNSDASTFARLSQTILLPNTRLSVDVMSLTWRVNTRRMDNYCHIWLVWQDANGVSLGQSTMGNWNDSTLNNYNVLKWENISIPIEAKQVDIRFETREGTNAYIFQPMVSFTDTIGTYVQGNYNNNAALAQVKVTADSISNFVRDASGNISSEFQTALSRTSIITGSTLASSIQTQTATQISSALTDNNGKIISLINQDSSGVQISGKNIVLDGNTTVTGTFKVNQANIANGAVGAAQIGDASITSAKIANLDASKISGGTISGIDFNVNRRMTIASGGIIHSDVMDITKDAFNLLGMMNNTKTFVTAYNTQVSFANAVYGIDSSSGEIHSSGKINTIHAQGDFTSSYSNDHLMFSTVNWTDGSEDNFVHITDANITILSGADSADTATDYSNISPVRIRTTGDMIAGSSITSGNIQLNSYHTIISQDGLPLYVTGNGGNPVDFNVNQLTANNIVLNAAHSIISKDNGKMYFYGGNGKQVDLGVKSLTQSSLVSLKENIAEVDEFDLLHKTISADLNRYNFIGDNDKYTHVTPMIDDVNGKKYIPKEWVSEDGRSVDTYTIIGYLVGSVKALQKQINKLEQG